MQCYVTPVLWNFSCNGQGKATLVGRILKVIHQGAVLGGAKSDVYDCLIRPGYNARSFVEPFCSVYMIALCYDTIRHVRNVMSRS